LIASLARRGLDSPVSAPQRSQRSSVAAPTSPEHCESLLLIDPSKRPAVQWRQFFIWALFSLHDRIASPSRETSTRLLRHGIAWHRMAWHRIASHRDPHHSNKAQRSDNKHLLLSHPVFLLSQDPLLNFAHPTGNVSRATFCARPLPPVQSWPGRMQLSLPKPRCRSPSGKNLPMIMMITKLHPALSVRSKSAAASTLGCRIRCYFSKQTSPYLSKLKASPRKSQS